MEKKWSTYVAEEFIHRIPIDFYPIRFKVKHGQATEEDSQLFKRLYEELGLTIREISCLTGWHERTIRSYLDRLNVKMRSAKDYRKFKNYKKSKEEDKYLLP